MDNSETPDSPITKDDVKANRGDEGADLDRQLLVYLTQHTSDQAGDLVSSSGECGFEAWRLLVKRYDPRTAESQQALIAKIMDAKPCKTIDELEREMQEWEHIMRRWQKAASRALDDDFKVTCIIRLCPARLQEHMNMSTRDDEGYDDVRAEIVGQIEKHRANSTPSPMDIGSYDYWAGETWGDAFEESATEDIGAVSSSTQCFTCGGHGHTASQCPSPKQGKGKGFGKGTAKGKGQFAKGAHASKGKSKSGAKGYPSKGSHGKGPGHAAQGGKGYAINGSCYQCGEFGHMAKDCWYPSPAGGQGNKGANCVDCASEESVDVCGFEVGLVDVLPSAAPSKPSFNVETRNAFDALADEGEEKSKLDVNAVSSGSEALGCTGKITIDSGAAESVIPKDMLPILPVESSPAEKTNAKYIAANGAIMRNVGQKRVRFRTSTGTINAITFQATDVRKPLASVARIVEKGNRVVFSPAESYIENVATGKRVPIEQENNTYVMNVTFVDGNNAEAQVFSRQG